MSNSQPERVLIVDDDDGNRMLLVHALKKASPSILEAEDGEAALALVDNTPFDVIFIDLELPDISGVNVLEAARATQPGAFIIIVTAYDAPTHFQRCFDAGADVFLIKPFDMATIVSLLQDYDRQDFYEHRRMLILGGSWKKRWISAD